MGNTANEYRFGLAALPQGSDSHDASGLGAVGAGRVHARHEVRLRTEVTLGRVGDRGGAQDGRPPSETHEAHVENIGFGGARLAIDGAAPAEVGDALTLFLVAPSLWDPLQLRARIVWVGGHVDVRTDGQAHRRATKPMRYVGVAFVHETPRGVAALHDLISALAYE